MQVVVDGDAISVPQSCYFLRHPTANEIGGMRCLYVIDGKSERLEAGRFENGDFHFDIDVDDVSDGLHNISYMLMLPNGSVTDIHTAFFTKIPLGGSGLVGYGYWLNDAYDDIKEIKINGRPATLTFTELLPVATMPLRSSSFHFEVNQLGIPQIYARNDFHIRFYSADGHLGEQTASYIDYDVHQDLVDVTTLLESTNITRPCPGRNEIQWYKIQAEAGDSINFNTNKACSIQLFSPLGEEIINVSGAESVRLNGCHTMEDGDYYLAIHDVTGNAQEITLNYENIDKYAVLRSDVHEVGNAGMSTITVEGNGFDSLYKVILCDSNGGTFESFDIGHESDSQTSVTFDFAYLPEGCYNAKFIFTEDELEVNNFVNVEEATQMDLSYDVSYPNIFLRDTFTTYTIKVKNHSNMTAYFVPMEIQMVSEGEISEIRFDGYVNPLGCQSFIDFDEMDPDDVQYFKENLYDIDDKAQFVYFTDTIANIDYGVSQVIMNLPPEKEIEFTISIKSNASVELLALMPESWIPCTSKDTNTMSKVIRRERATKMCCWKDRFNCTGDIIVSLFSYKIPPHLSCLTSLSKTGLQTFYDVWCQDGDDINERWHNYLKSGGQSLQLRLIESVVECVSGYYKMLLKSLRKDYIFAKTIGNNSEADRIFSEILACRTAWSGVVRGIYDSIVNIAGVGDCVKSWRTQKPNCPPEPPIGGSSNGVDSLDPNDILGYLSQSGSHYVGIEQNMLPYTIEFENDSDLATAAAHKIIVSDRVDLNIFDINSIHTTKITLGKHEVFVDFYGEFVTTIDMRPQINALAQVELSVNKATGEMVYTISSLDPMTVEPTDDVMAGILPINNDGGDGQGYISFELKVLDGLKDGVSIDNSASIIFDSNQPISTPVWHNEADYVRPVSSVVKAVSLDDNTAVIYIDGMDERSGIWKYDVYLQYGDDTDWVLCSEGLESDTVTVKTYPNIDYGFCVIAYDNAGNIERKELRREASLTPYLKGDANNDGLVTIADFTVIINHLLDRPNNNFLFEGADVDGNGIILISDATSVINILLDKGQSGKNNVSRMYVHEQSSRYYNISDVCLDDHGKGISIISVDNASDYCSLQFDIDLPYGIKISDIVLNDDILATHQLSYGMIDDNTMRVLIYSLSNTHLNGNDIAAVHLSSVSDCVSECNVVNLNGGYVICCLADGVYQHVASAASAIVSTKISGLTDFVIGGMSVKSENMQIIIELNRDTEVTITDISGLTSIYSLGTGINYISVPVAGTYIVNGHKLLVK